MLYLLNKTVSAPYVMPHALLGEGSQWTTTTIVASVNSPVALASGAFFAAPVITLLNDSTQLKDSQIEWGGI